jgi:hypothetical protein
MPYTSWLTAHEVATAARRDVVGEPVLRQVAEQLDHRCVRTFRYPRPRVDAARLQELLGLGIEVVDAHPVVRGEDAGGEHVHVVSSPA